jgi:hypothetical protein
VIAGLAAGDGGKKGEFVSVVQYMVRGAMLTVDDPEKSDRCGDLHGTYNVINGRTVGKCGNLFIGAELTKRCKKFYFHVHNNSIPDFLIQMESLDLQFPGSCRKRIHCISEQLPYDRHHTCARCVV